MSLFRSVMHAQTECARLQSSISRSEARISLLPASEITAKEDLKKIKSAIAQQLAEVEKWLAVAEKIQESGQLPQGAFPFRDGTEDSGQWWSLNDPHLIAHECPNQGWYPVEGKAGEIETCDRCSATLPQKFRTFRPS